MKELAVLNSSGNINEAIDFYNEHCSNVEKMVIAAEAISVDTNGIVHCDGNKLELSEPGLKTISRIVNIPVKFASRIPTHLLSENVNELKIGKDDLIDIYYQDGVLLSAVKAPSVSIPSDLILSEIGNYIPDFKIRDIFVSPVELRIKTTSPTLTIGDVKVGDITEIGYMFNTSPTAYIRPSGQIFLYELKCTNGAVLGIKQGGFKMRARSVDNMKFIESFFNQVSDLERIQERLTKNLRRSYEAHPTYKEIYSIFSRVKKITGDKDVSMSCLELEDDEDIYSLRALVSSDDTVLDTYEDLTYRNIIFNITSAANSYTGDTKLRLQKLAGKILFSLS